MSTLDIKLVYTPREEMKMSDYYLRHPFVSTDKKCHICKLAFEIEVIGDNSNHMMKKLQLMILRKVKPPCHLHKEQRGYKYRTNWG